MIYIDAQMPTNCYDCWIRQNMGCSIADDSGWPIDRRADNCPIQAQEPHVMTLEECGCNGGYHSEDWYCADGKRRDYDASIPPEWLEKVIDQYTREQTEEENFMNESLFPRRQEERIEYKNTSTN